MNDAQEKLMKNLMALGFMALDLQLYLDTHPYDSQALIVYLNTVQRCKMIKDNYEQMYGPITACASNSYPWPWINSPWPWECQ